MRTNTNNLTVYNKWIDPTARAEQYQRSQIGAVAWENRKAANVLRSGLLAADSVVVYVPFQRGVNHLDPIEWQALVSKTGKWTFAVGDVIVKGLVTDEITGGFTVTSLKAKYDNVVVIKSVDTMDSGSLVMQHWKLSAQ